MAAAENFIVIRVSTWQVCEDKKKDWCSGANAVVGIEKTPFESFLLLTLYGALGE